MPIKRTIFVARFLGATNGKKSSFRKKFGRIKCWNGWDTKSIWKMNQKFELQTLVSNNLEVSVTWWKTISFTIFFYKGSVQIRVKKWVTGGWGNKLCDENPLAFKKTKHCQGPGSGIQTFKRQVRYFSDLECSPPLIILSYPTRTHHPNPKQCWKWERYFEWA